MPEKLLAEFRQNAHDLQEDLDGKSAELMMQGTGWAIVCDDAATPCALAKYHKNERGGVDLSEVVKNPQMDSGGIAALFKWAYFYEKDGNAELTLTAATVKLVSIYESYGFQLSGPIHPGIRMTLRSGDGFTRVNLPMTMINPSAEVLSAMYQVVPV